MEPGIGGIETKVKRWATAVLAAGLLAAGSASAADCTSSNPCYETIPYYNNDPFTFCTLGVPQHCWMPISKELGTYAVTNQYCFNPHSAQIFARVCPKAFQPAGGGSTSARDPASADP